MTGAEWWERWTKLWRFVGQITKANDLVDRAMESVFKKFNDKLYS